MSEAFRITRRVQFAETDLAGVLHFSHYFRYMEEVEHAFLRSLGFSVVDPGGIEVLSWPRVSASCEYVSAARFEDELTLSLRVVEMGERSVCYEIEFNRGTERIAVGRIKAVCCAMREGRFQSQPIPDAWRQRLGAFLDSR
ncbi:MAG: acyl-CoA thioesterase [Planctomycetota bacterium]|nr:MAG: acyl-CoA thioesterase [Planctomycetota bacterium]